MDCQSDLSFEKSYEKSMEEIIEKEGIKLEVPMTLLLDKRDIRESDKETLSLSIEVVSSWPPWSTKNGSLKLKISHEIDSSK